MINALVNGLSLLIRKPYLILASLMFSAISMIAFFLNVETITYFFLNIAYGIIPNISPKTMLVDFILMYSNEIIVLTAIFLFTVLMNFLTYAVYSAYVKENNEGGKGKASFGASFKEGLSKTLPLLGFVLIIFFLGLFLAAICLLLMSFVGNNFLANIAIATVVAVLLIYLLVKLLFVVPAIFDAEAKASSGKIKAKNSALAQAISKSWNFSSRKFMAIFILIIILAVINAFFSTLIGSFVYPILDENIKLAAATILTAILTTYSCIVLAMFYFKK